MCTIAIYKFPLWNHSYVSGLSKHTVVADESSRTAVCSSCSFSTLKLWSSVGVFLQGCLATSIHDEFAAHKMYQPFLIIERTRWMLCPRDRGVGVNFTELTWHYMKSF